MSKRGSRRGRPAKDKKKTFKEFRASNRPTRTNRRTTTKFDDSGRESGIRAAKTTTTTSKIKGLEQSVGSLDRRINEALKQGNTDLAKDLRSRLNKFTTRLGDERAIRSGGVLRSNDGRVVRTSTGRPVLTSEGFDIFNKTKDMDFLDPTRNLINKYPDQYAKMYPITDQLRRGLPGIRAAKEFLGMDDKKQKFTDSKMPGIRYPLDKTFGAGEGIEAVMDDRIIAGEFDKGLDVAPDAVSSVDITGRAMDVAPPGVPFQTMVDSDQPSFPTIVNPTEYDLSTADMDKEVALGDDSYKTVKADAFVPKVVDFADFQRVNPKLLDLTQPSFAELDQEFQKESLQQKEPPKMTTMSGSDFVNQVAQNNLQLKENVINNPSLNNAQKLAIVNQIDNLTQFQPMIDQTSILDVDPGQSMFPTASINALNQANPESEAAALEILNSLDNQNQGFNLLDFLSDSLDANPDQPGTQFFNLNPIR